MGCPLNLINELPCTMQPRDLPYLSFQYAPEPTASCLLPLLSIGSSSQALRHRMDNAGGRHKFTTEVSKWEPIRGVSCHRKVFDRINVSIKTLRLTSLGSMYIAR